MLRRTAVAAALCLASAACAGSVARTDFRAELAAPEFPPVENCVPLQGAGDGDGDFARSSREALTAPGLCISIVSFNDRGRAWTLQRIFSGRPGPLWIVPHDDEDSGFVSGVAALEQYGGVLVAVDTGGQRANGPLNPNGVFGYAPSCAGSGRPVAPRYTYEALRYRFPGQPIIALHSNDPGYEGAGSGDVSMDYRKAFRQHYAAASDFPGARSQRDTLVFVAGLSAFPPATLMREIDLLNGRRINVIYEFVEARRTDCSLSNFAVLENIAPYYNVEVVNGDAATQLQMIAAIMSMRQN